MLFDDSMIETLVKLVVKRFDLTSIIKILIDNDIT